MALAELWSYLRGYVIIRVKGGALECFMNAVSARGICLWDVVRLDESSLVTRVRLRDLPEVGRMLKGAGCAGRVEQKVGVPFFVMKLARRRGLAAGVILFSAVLYALSSFVWFVEVRGLEKAGPEAVQDFAAREGARPGVLKRSLDPSSLSRKILAAFPEFAWVGVRVRGTRVNIEIVEKALPEAKAGVVDVVAAQDALVTNVIVLSGEPVVQEGETVTKGQTLIAGLILGGRAGAGGAGDRPETVNAKGIVLGRVWRSYTEVVPLVRLVETATGRVKRARRLTIGTFSVRIGPATSPFSAFVVEERSFSIPLPSAIKVPVRVDDTRYLEVTRRTEVTEANEAQARLRGKAREEIAARLPRDARILDERENVKYSQKRSLAYEYTVETVEDIAEERREERTLERTAN